jgi:hypothetical protein
MRKQILVAAAVGTLAIIPTPASAHGHGPVGPGLASSLGIQIIVRDGPKVVHHHHHTKRQVRARPWPRYFGHPAPAWRWQGVRHHRPRHFDGHDRGRGRWFRAPGWQHGNGPHLKHGQPKYRHDLPWHHGRASVRDRFPYDRFGRDRGRSDHYRHRN